MVTQHQYHEMLLRTAPARPKPNEFAVEDESDLHGDIKKFCRNKGWRYINARMDKRSTVGEGTCDFIIAADQGRVFWFEAKSKRGKLSMEQRTFIVWLENLGHKVAVVSSMDEFVEHISQK